MVVPSKQSSGRLDEDLGFAECRGLNTWNIFLGGRGGFLIMVLLELVYTPPKKKKLFKLLRPLRYEGYDRFVQPVQLFLG